MTCVESSDLPSTTETYPKVGDVVHTTDEKIVKLITIQ